jgi:hypothetical protein
MAIDDLAKVGFMGGLGNDYHARLNLRRRARRSGLYRLRFVAEAECCLKPIH